jgi:hypothetical protein
MDQVQTRNYFLAVGLLLLTIFTIACVCLLGAEEPEVRGAALGSLASLIGAIIAIVAASLAWQAAQQVRSDARLAEADREAAGAVAVSQFAVAVVARVRWILSGDGTRVTSNLIGIPADTVRDTTATGAPSGILYPFLVLRAEIDRYDIHPVQKISALSSHVTYIAGPGKTERVLALQGIGQNALDLLSITEAYGGAMVSDIDAPAVH